MILRMQEEVLFQKYCDIFTAGYIYWYNVKLSIVPFTLPGIGDPNHMSDIQYLQKVNGIGYSQIHFVPHLYEELTLICIDICQSKNRLQLFCHSDWHVIKCYTCLLCLYMNNAAYTQAAMSALILLLCLKM